MNSLMVGPECRRCLSVTLGRHTRKSWLVVGPGCGGCVGGTEAVKKRRGGGGGGGGEDLCHVFASEREG